MEVEGEPGIGYILRPGSLLPPLSFTEDELHALVIGTQWVSRQADNSLAQAVTNALAKINAVLPAHLRPVIDDDAIYIGYPAKSAIPLNLSEVRRAIREQRKLRIKLPATHTLVGEHLIWPIMLGFIDGERFIAAWRETEEQFHVFGMSEIESAEVLLERYARNRRELVKAWQAQDLRPCNSRE
uniref:helix-turn-helix transcriptional regulator n=1 Tax=Pseudomonas capsici TaxID=2810614 RepID=UPI00298DFF26|nr:WYL domain-containing protein [Pseudomonas capsici]